MIHQKLELILLVVRLAFLAGVLAFVGLAVRKFLNAIADSRRQASIREQTLVAASAHARALARSKRNA